MSFNRTWRWLYWLVLAAGVGVMIITSCPPWSEAVVVAAGVVLGVALMRNTRGRAPSRSGGGESRRTSTPVDRPRRDERTIPGMLEQGRHAYVIQKREKWADHQDAEELLIQAVEQLEAQLALVPEGAVQLRLSLSGEPCKHDIEDRVEPFLIQSVAVTNEMYQHFVDAGGYENADLWPEDLLPLVIEFRDTTGQIGPRFWVDGSYPRGQGDFPVVGVSCFEAAAYSKWVGQRLPTEAEWQMAANWRVSGSSKTYQRAFPWGDTMDHGRCNVWAAQRGGPVPESEYPDGSAPNDVRQLIGNVWEWTASDFSARDDEGREVRTDYLAKCIRGGAFDTFFECQATSEFRTGQNPLARKHNIGFRCALSADEIPILVSA